ncbi:MAG TPA: aspartate 1-decarboxylase [Nitrospirae bacterium]|nr:aspartate 1-decarboxylase [Nitrospirota bacterium]
MLSCMLRSKIHMATVTDSNINYEGSLTIDETLLAAANIKPYEQIMISNLNNGERFETYVIPGKKNSGMMCLNGPTARKGTIGDKIIIFCYSYYTEEETEKFSPTIIRVNSKNKITK